MVLSSSTRSGFLELQSRKFGNTWFWSSFVPYSTYVPVTVGREREREQFGDRGRRKSPGRPGGMAEQKPWAEWLPPGWTAEVRVRKTGKKDMCYTDPSSGLKFFSKPEVFRFLNNIESSTSRGKRIGTRTRTRSRSRKLSAINSPVVAEKLNLPESRANEPMTTNPSSKVVRLFKDDQTFETCTGGKGSSMICFTLPRATNLEQREKSDPRAIVGAHSDNRVENRGPNPANKRSKLGIIVNSEKREKSDPSAVVRALSDNLAENGVANPAHKRSKLGIIVDSEQREKSDPGAVVGSLSNNRVENGVANPANKRSKLGIIVDSEQREKTDPSAVVRSLSDNRAENGAANAAHKRSKLGIIVDSEKSEKSDPSAVVRSLSDNRTENGVANPAHKRSKLGITVDSEQREKSDPCAVVGSLSDNRAENGVANPANKRSKLGIIVDSEHREKSDLIAVVGALSDNPVENGVANSANKRSKLGISEKNNREKPNLPRRASKRLAGIQVEPIAELKTNNRTHRVSARRIDEAEASKTEKLLERAAPEKCVEKRATEDIGDDEKPDEERGGSPLNYALKDLWTDPCIEFAIKTLMDAIPVEDENQAEENRSTSVELPFGDSWGDPCIDFAVKTLTGAIPVADDLGIPDCLFTSSSETMQDKGSDSNAGLHYSSDAGMHPHCEERSDEHQRNAIRG